MGCQIKYADHPASSDQIIELGTTGGTENSSIGVRSGSTDNSFGAHSIDSGGTLVSSFGTVNPATYDGVWFGVVSVNTSTTSRTHYAGVIGNTDTNTTSNDPGSALDEIFIGTRLTAAGDWINSLAECFVYNGVMTTQDITDYLAGTEPVCLAGAANLLGYWRFDSDLSGTYPDESGQSGPTVTLAGSVAFTSDHPTMTGCGASTAPKRMRKLE